MGGSVLVVASWGDPFSWEPVDYVLNDRRERSRSSLPVLARAYPGASVLVIVQETLLAPRSIHKVRERLKEAGISEEPPLLSHAYSREDYLRLRERLASILTSLVQAWVGVGARAAVAPGVGDFPFRDDDCVEWRGVWRIAEGAGTPFDYYASTVLLEIIREMPRDPGPLRLVVDLSHGINYTATALYRAAIAAARLYATANHTTVTLEVYNSEPWTPGVRELRVWKIREEQIHYRAAASQLVYTMLAHRPGEGKIMAQLDKALLTGEGYNHVKQKISRELGEPRRRISMLTGTAGMAAASIIGGFPLLLLEAGREATEKQVDWHTLAQTASKILDVLPQATLERQEHRIIVEHALGLSLDATKSLLAGLSLASHAAHAYNKLKQETTTTRCNSRERVAATIEALWKTLDSFIATPLVEITKRELSKLSEYKKKQEQPSEDLYHRISQAVANRKNYPANPHDSDIIDPRIFSAHAGLNSNIIDVLYQNNNIYLSYNCKTLDKVQGVSIAILKQLKQTVFTNVKK